MKRILPTCDAAPLTAELLTTTFCLWQTLTGRCTDGCDVFKTVRSGSVLIGFLSAKVCTCAEEAELLAVVFFGWSRRDVRYSPGEWRCHKNQVKITKITSRLADGFGLVNFSILSCLELDTVSHQWCEHFYRLLYSSTRHIERWEEKETLN